MSEHINVEHAFDPEAFQAQKDMNEYTATRPYEDDRGNFHNPDNGQYINPDNYFDAQREANEVTKSYEDMTTYELVSKYVDAKHHGDRTMLSDIEDVVQERAAARQDSSAAHKVERSAVWHKDGDSNGTKTSESDDYIQGFFTQVEKREAKSAASVNKKTEKTSDDEVVLTGNPVSAERHQEISEKIIAIKDAMAERASKGLDSPDYDAEFEDAQDEKIKKLLAEAIGATDVNDPRVTEALKQFDQYEAQKTEQASKQDSENAARNIINRIAEGRFNGEWGTADDEQAFLEFAEELKKAFGTDDLDDPRIQRALDRATDAVSAKFRQLNGEEVSLDDEAASLRRDLDSIPDLERPEASDATDITVYTEMLDSLNNEHQSATADIRLNAKLDSLKTYVASGELSAQDAMNVLLHASAEDIDAIARKAFVDGGVPDPSEEQLNGYKQLIMNNLNNSFQEVEPVKEVEDEATAEHEVQPKRTWRQRISDLSTKIYVSTNEYFTHPEKGRRRRSVVAAVAGVVAVGALWKYGLPSFGGNGEEQHLTEAQKQVMENPANFNRMIKWYTGFKEAHPNLTNEQIAEIFKQGAAA